MSMVFWGMGRVLTIVPPGVSKDTIQALTYLLQEARAGNITGLAYVAMHKANDFSIDHAGEVRSYPLASIGAIRILADELVALAKK